MKTPTGFYGNGLRRFCVLSLGRSCPFNCTFCYHPSGTKYRRRSLENFFQELDYLIGKYDIENVFISDETFLPKLEDLKEFCAEIAKRKIGFSIYHRVDMVNRQILEILRDHGCKQICFGLESADNQILESMEKHITIEQIETALSLCNEVGISTAGGFIFGDVEETVETAGNTIRWWKKHPQYSITTGLIIVFPGTALYQHALNRGIIKDEVQFIKDGCPYINVSKMTDEEYKTMAMEISMLSQGRTDVLKDASIKNRNFGTVDYTARCSKCGEMNTWYALEPFRSKTNILCEKCGNSMHVIAADSVEHNADEHFQLLKEHRVAIWPVINVLEELRRIAPSIMGDNVYLIDSSSFKQGASYHGKIVQSPDIIKEKEIDTVFLTVTNAVTVEIIESIKKYPSVKHIFFAADLLSPDFPERLLY